MPNFDKPTGFTMKMGSKEIYDESSPFSMRDTALMKASPMLKPLKGNQDKLPQEFKQAILDSPMNKNGKDKIKTEELDNVTVTANSPETIRKNVKANVKGAYFGPKGEEKDRGRYTPAARKKEVSSQDYRIYKRTRKS